MINPIATRSFNCVDPDGEQFEFTVEIGQPTPLSDQPGSDWCCPLTLPFDNKERKLFGVDSWQALGLALSLVYSELAGFLERGGKLYYPDTTDEFVLGDFSHFLRGG
ncbi:MAG TPA: hypothetical protein VGM54_21985 [Chthoniobacter sp.]|jgi:hypothetical protein